MKVESYEHGVPSWVDMGSPDPAKSAEFYGALFGWTSEEGPPEVGGYRVCLLDGSSVAGLGPQQNPGPPVWMTYVNVTDVDEIAKRVADGGGRELMAPMDVMDMGRMAVFADPTGAAFSVWQAKVYAGAGRVNEPGAYSWSELVTTDLVAATAFYTDVFGWTPETHAGAGPGGYTEWKLGGRPVAGMMAKPPMMPAEVPSHWMVYFGVADADVAVARVTELGGRLIMGPMDIEPGRFAVVSDPAGATFSVIATKGMTGG